MAKAAQQCFRETVFVPRPLIAPTIEEKRGRHDHAAPRRARAIPLDMPLGRNRCRSRLAVRRNHSELTLESLEISRRESRTLFHECVMDRPKLAGLFKHALREI